MNLQESDFISINDFSLVWRWTQESHNVLPEAVLDSIKPLSKQISQEIYDQGLNYYQEFEEDKYQIFEASFDNVQFGRKSLEALIENKGEEIFLVWNQETALVTTWKTFTNYWDDFCYPGSDDVFIFPRSISWLLVYRHFEQFEFRKLNPAT